MITSEGLLLVDAELKFSKFISSIASDVSPSTQNQAWNAIVMLYRDVLRYSLGEIPGAMRSKRTPRIRPIPASHADSVAIIESIPGDIGLALKLIYGAALRIKECLRLRIKDFDFAENQILIYSGKGNKDAFVPMPVKLKDDLQDLITRRKALHLKDRQHRLGWVWLPDSLGKKYPKWHYAAEWQYVFASARTSIDPQSGNEGRHHLSPEAVQQAMAKACRKLGIKKRFTPHSLRHAAARFSEKNGTPISEIQRWLRHSDVETTLRYLGMGEQRCARVVGPMD